MHNCTSRAAQSKIFALVIPYLYLYGPKQAGSEVELLLIGLLHIFSAEVWQCQLVHSGLNLERTFRNQAGMTGLKDGRA